MDFQGLLTIISSTNYSGKAGFYKSKILLLQIIASADTTSSFFSSLFHFHIKLIIMKDLFRLSTLST